MRGVRVGAIAIAAGILIAVGVSAPAFANGGEIYPGTNSARASAGLGALRLNGSLNSVAQNWANQMAANQSMVHNPAVASQVPGGWQAVGENIGTGYPSGAATLDAWLESPPHRTNIMGNYTDIGVGWTVDGNGVSWAVQVFARYPAPAPPPAPAPAPAPKPAPAPPPKPVPAPAPAPAAPAASTPVTQAAKAAPASAQTQVPPASVAGSPAAAPPVSNSPKASRAVTAQRTKSPSLFSTITPQPRERLQARTVDSTTALDGGSVLLTTTLILVIVLLGASLFTRLRRRSPREH